MSQPRGSSPSGPVPGPALAAEELVGHSAAMLELRQRLASLAHSQASILIQGESGTGKSAAARWLHQASDRASGPLVTASLAAVPPALLEAELFGHEKGAFTDAHRARPGLFRRAHGGTLLLDDIDLLPPELQPKLLRVLQERVVEPLGGERSEAVDLRLVCTSNAALQELVRLGRFRQDLFFRLAVVVLELPPLRARESDLVELVPLLLARAAARLGCAVRSLSPAALARLQAHPWPGNVRELENALERVLALAPDRAQPIEAGELAFLAEVLEGAPQLLARAALAQGVELEVLSQALMRAALREQRGNWSAAARQLGLTRRALEYRLGAGTQAQAAEDSAP